MAHTISADQGVHSNSFRISLLDSPSRIGGCPHTLLLLAPLPPSLVTGPAGISGSGDSLHYLTTVRLELNEALRQAGGSIWRRRAPATASAAELVRPRLLCIFLFLLIVWHRESIAAPVVGSQGSDGISAASKRQLCLPPPMTWKPCSVEIGAEE